MNADKRDLSERLKSSGWRLVEGGTEHKSGTLEDVAREAHRRKTQGHKPGLIQEIETRLELDLIALEQLWTQLGLPL